MTARIAILGGYPPPYGGVTAHVQRLSSLLDRRGISCTVYNAVSDSENGRNVISVARHRREWVVRYALTGKEPLVYVCSARLEAWVLAAVMARRGRHVIIRLRNACLLDYLERPHTRMLASWALRNVGHVVAVSERLASAARSAGVHPDRVFYLPGFLPPDLSEEPTESQRAFAAAHHPLLTANGKIDRYRGVDLYGLDLLVELIARLRATHPRIGLVFSFTDHAPADAQALEVLVARARALGVAERILFHTTPAPFVPVLRRSDLFLRPSVTDGDANSVREAMYLGIPTIASDAVERPPGAILVRSRDLDDLVAKTDHALREPPSREPHREVIDEARVERFLDLLRRFS